MYLTAAPTSTSFSVAGGPASGSVHYVATGVRASLSSTASAKLTTTAKVSKTSTRVNRMTVKP